MQKLGVNKEARSIKTAKTGVHSTKTENKMWIKIGVNRIERVRCGRKWETQCLLKG